MWVARYLVVYLKRPGGQAQFSDVLRLQTKDAVFDRLHSWIAGHLTNDLSVDALARQVGMGGRTSSSAAIVPRSATPPLAR